MEEVSHQVNTQDVIINQMLQELEKVQLLQRQVNHMYSITDELTQQVKQIQQSKKQEQQKEEIQQEIIPKNVSSSLTSNQKKRYENIGKQFVQGAGKQFQRIKKAISFKEKMKTSNDKFVQDVKKTKEKTSKIAKKSSFWKKFLAVIGIIGLVAILFKDKIAKLLPDFSKGNDNFFSNFKQNITGLLGSLFIYLKQLVGGTVSGMFQFIAKSLLPDMVDQFFTFTLPRAIVSTVLTMMSLFSQGAESQLSSFLSEDAKATADETANLAQQGLKNRAYDDTQEETTVVLNTNFEKMSLRQLEYQKLFWFENIAEQQLKVWEEKGLMNLIDKETDVELSSNSDLIPYMQIAKDVQDAMKDSELSKEEAQKILNENFRKFRVEEGDIQVNDDIITQMKNFYEASLGPKSKWTELCDTIRNLQNQKKDNEKNRKNLKSQSEGQIEGIEHAKIKSLKVDISDIIATKLSESLRQPLNALGNFLGVTNGSHSKIVNIVGNFFNMIGAAASVFFVGAMETIDSVLRNIHGFYYQFEKKPNNSKKPLKHVVNITDGLTSNNMIFNINIDDAYISQYGRVILSLAENVSQMNTQINKGNAILEKILIDISVVGSSKYKDDARTMFSNLKGEVEEISLIANEAKGKSTKNQGEIGKILAALNGQKDSVQEVGEVPKGISDDES